MGYWTQSEDGVSFAGEDREPEPLMWGDQPTDIVDDAIHQIITTFMFDLGRLPSKAEVMAGLTFSTRILDLPDRPEDAPALSDEDWQTVNTNYWPSNRGDERTPRRVLNAQKAMGQVVRRLTAPYQQPAPEPTTD